jgi:hypothetical protein
MTRRLLLLAAFVTLAATAAVAGGKANISVSQLPKTITAAVAFPVEFTVQHPDGSPIADLEPVIIATRGKERVSLKAEPAGSAGRYAARVTLPSGGRWTLTVDSRYCHNTAVLRNVMAKGPSTASAKR